MPKISRRLFIIGGAAAIGTAGAAVGYQQRRRIREIQYSFSPTPDLSTLIDFDEDEALDVCIIGSGPAGAVLGTALARQGLRTAIFESGFDLRGEVDPRVSQLETYRSSGPVIYPLIGTRLRALGGTSNLWTGRCERLQPIDFEKNAYTPEGAEWPISYAELEPYFQRAEETLRVAASNISDYHAPRRAPLPLQARHDSSALIKLMEGVGITVDDVPTSMGRWTSGPVRAIYELLPQFTRERDAKLVTGATATRIIAEADGTISGIEIQNLDQVKKRIKAKAYVIACGAVESARLLLLSKSEAFPNGIGNGHDLVGRNFSEHPHAFYIGTIKEQVGTPQYARTQQFYNSFKKEGLGSVFLVTQWYDRPEANFRLAYAMEMEPKPDNRITLADDMVDAFGNPGTDLHIEFSEKDLATKERAEALIYKVFSDLGATDIEKQYSGWGHHHIGTTRMGNDSTTSVLDANLRLHASPNLYVLSSAAFVTSGPDHPTLAITALAHRLADHLPGTLN